MSGQAEIRTITQAERAEFCALRRYAFRTWSADAPTDTEIDWIVPDEGSILDTVPSMVSTIHTASGAVAMSAGPCPIG